MEKIKLEFTVQSNIIVSSSMFVLMTLDETGNKCIAKIVDAINGKQKEPTALPNRVLKAFTENTINKILAKDEIPNESGISVLDGYNYKIKLTKGDICKEYNADDANIESYPLLRYLASWCRHQM